ncbi:hypothetical protein EMIHUDRAFT_458400 [Emiliania huxleyi CCMP1516]|uniref:Myb-like domain-containing protein n=2 Tax=Emiliania huxleyi TaxID=2903 RepID=A0A0D3JCT1_EMIH1|nr:hypothetical protein EMIHUDRAFT_458400 [Emiliania huxleyi CCMP1516]EOD21316.1 hypothetical protein EMIHUDRAFT_458400 [Emiliania huxleyi CCMP1516]|eukprot:XP_005773745.1 hypothetical protein EMIHUDRAFT_458400 [Emiliania huxleyi CCMP1516]
MLSAVTPAEVNAIDPPAPPDASPEPDERPPAKARKRPRPTERCGWTPEADKWVAHGYETLGPCWTAIAALLRRETGEDRSGDSVRNRVLRLQQQQGKADDRGGDCWTTQEVDLICQGVLRGLRWKDIADMLPGRTESSCRNRWVRHKQKELSGMGVEAKTAVDQMAPHQLPQPSQLPPPCQLPQYNQLSAQRWVPGPLMGLPMAQAMPMPPSQLIPMWGPPQYADDQAALSAEDRYRARLRLAEKEGRLPKGVVARILGTMAATPSAA